MTAEYDSRKGHGRKKDIDKRSADVILTF